MFFTHPDKSFQSSDPLPHPLSLDSLHPKRRGGGLAGDYLSSDILADHSETSAPIGENISEIMLIADFRRSSRLLAIRPRFLRYAFVSSRAITHGTVRGAVASSLEVRDHERRSVPVLLVHAGLFTCITDTPSVRSRRAFASTPVRYSSSLLPPVKKLVLTNSSLPPPPDRHSADSVCPREGPKSSNPPRIPGRSSCFDELVCQPVYGLKGRI